MSDKITLNESAVQHVGCGRCGLQYDYDHVAQAEAERYTLTGNDLAGGQQRARAEAKLDRIFEQGLIVPCPKCKALTPAMKHRLTMAVLQDLVVAGIALAVAAGVWLMAQDSGKLALGIGVLALLTALGFTIKALALPFGGYNEGTGRPAGAPAPATADDIFNSLRMPTDQGRRRD